MSISVYLDEYDSPICVTSTSNIEKPFRDFWKHGFYSRKLTCSLGNETDESIVVDVLLGFYNPLFNDCSIRYESTIVPYALIESLPWKEEETYQRFTSNQKKKLARYLHDFDFWKRSDQIRFVELAYQMYIVNHLSGADDEKAEYDYYFEMILSKAMNWNRGWHRREMFCEIISNANLPDLNVKWYEFCIGVMNVANYKRYGDVDRAFANNPHMSKEIIDLLRPRCWVEVLPEYDFDKSDDQKPVSETEAVQDSDNKIEVSFWIG